MRKVSIVGVGCTRIGELWHKSLKDLIYEASAKALEESGEASRLDAVYVGNMASNVFQSQGNLGALTCDCLGLFGIPAARIEAAGASGGMAFYSAFRAVQSGEADRVLVLGVEKVADANRPADVAAAMLMGEDQDYVGYSGVTYHGLQAMLANLYMERFEVSREHLAQFAVNAHRNAAKNPHAQFKNPIGLDDVLRSPLVADPLRLLECASPGDGAAAVLLCPAEEAKRFSDTPIEVLASAASTEPLNLSSREDILAFDSIRGAARLAFQAAKLTPGEVDVAEVHDSTTIMGILSVEELGFAQRGRGAVALADENGQQGSLVPINNLGGLKGRGDPPGATGIYQLVDLVAQLRGEAAGGPPRAPTIGLALNVGGLGAVSTVSILGRR